MGIFRRFKRRKQSKKAHTNHNTSFMLERLEPRILLSADFSAGSAAVLADGLDQFGNRIEVFLDSEGLADGLLGTQMPFIVQIEQQGDDVKNVAPTIGTLFSVPVDFNGDDEITGNEIELQKLDVNPSEGVGDPIGDGTVDAGEFLQGWFFNRAETLLRDSGFGDNKLTSYLEINLEDFDKTLDMGNGTVITFTVGDVIDYSTGLDDPSTGIVEHVPAGEIAWYVPFQLKVSQNLAIDLGLEADALKIVPFDKIEYNATGEMITPTIPVDATIDFGFTVGVNTGGQEPALPGEVLDTGDFFVRSADVLSVSILSDQSGFEPFLNIGFLGAEVVSGEIHLQADVETTLVDPNDPAVLGFTVGQYGFRYDTGTITAINPIPNADLDHEAQFSLRIGNLGIVTEVTVADNNRSELDDGIQNNSNDLLDDINAALVTAGLNGLVTASLTGDNKLQFTLVSTTGTPLGFANESIGFTGVLSGTPNSGDATYPYEYADDVTFLLSVGGAVPELVNVRFPDPAQEDIGFGDSQIAILPDLVAENEPTQYDITADATFAIGIRKSDGTAVADLFVLTATDTDGNTNYYHLADDINTKLASSSLNGFIQAVYDGTNIRFQPIGVSVRAIDVYALGTATSEIGFAVHQMTTLTLTAINAPISTFDLTDDAHLKLTIATTDGSADIEVTIPADLNADADALAADINNAIDTALATLGDKVDVVVDSSGRIVLKAVDASVYALSITTVNTTIDDLVADVNRALVKAGLGSAVTASTDGTKLILTAAGSKTLEITKTLALDAGFTYAELQTPDPDEPGGDPADGTATADLFSPQPGEFSNINFTLPVEVLDGLDDATILGQGDDYNPINLAIVGNFNPFGSYAQGNFDPVEERFNLALDVNPDEQSDGDVVVAPIAVPAVGSLSETIQLVNFAEPLNFNLVTAESMIGLLKSLGAALQEIAGSSFFSLYDIPFSTASLSDMLVFDELIQTTLIYDFGADGVFNDDPLVSNASADDISKLLVRNIIRPVEGPVELLPGFKTAQELAEALKNILSVDIMEGIGGINPTYNLKTNELTYEVELLSGDRVSVGVPDLSDPAGDPPDVDPVPDPFEVPFEFDVDLSPFGKLTVDETGAPGTANVRLQAHTGLGMTFGINLSPPGAVILDSTPIGELNGGEGVDIKTERAVTGDDNVRTLYSLSADAHFAIDINGSEDWIPVEIKAVDTANNLSLNELVTDINSALSTALNQYDLDNGTSYTGEVVAGADGPRLTLSATGGASTIRLISISFGPEEDPTVTELGFISSLTPAEKITAQKYAPAIVGRLTGDATFEIDILTDASGSAVSADPITVTVPASATATNKTIADLVADVNNALVLAIEERLSDPDDPLTLAGFDDSLIKADFDVSAAIGARLVITATDPDIEFTLLTMSNPAIHDLGLPGSIKTADQADFVIFDRAGTEHRIILDSLNPETDSVDDLKTLIYEATEHAVTVEFNATHTGLRLVDNTAGTGTFRVETINGSGALLQLGFMNEYNPDNPDYIEGGPIGLTHLNDRFFVKDAEMRGEGIRLDTPTQTLAYPDGGINGEALFGIVGLDVNVKGTIFAEMTADLQAAGDTAGSQVTLTDLQAGTKYGKLQYDNQTTDFVVGSILTGDDSDATAMILEDQDDGDHGTLTVKMIQGTFQNDEEIKVGDTVAAIVNGEFSTIVTNPVVNKAREISYTDQTEDFTPGSIITGADSEATAIILADDENGTSGTLTVFHIRGSFLDGEEIEDDLGGKADANISVASEDEYGQIQYDGQTTDFVVGSTVTGGTSGATAEIMADEDGGTAGTLTLKIIQGTFQNDEEIKVGDTVAAFVNGSLAEKEVTRLQYTDKTSDFTVNSFVTGDTSLAKALVLADSDNTLTLVIISNTFLDGETITGGGGSAVVDGSLPTKANFGEFNLYVDVQDGFGGVGFGGGFALLDGQSYTVDFALTEFGNPFDPAPPVAAFYNLDNDIGDLAAFEYLDYTDLLVALKGIPETDTTPAVQGLLGMLESVDNNFVLLNTPIPAINRSVSDLLSLVDGFARSVDNADEVFQAATDALAPDALDLPALRLQDIPKALRGAFGLPDNVTPDPNDPADPDDTFTVDWVRLDFDKTNNMLLMDFSLNEALSTKLGLDINGLEDEDGNPLPNLTSGGVLKVTGSLDLNLNVGIDLDAPSDPAAPNDAYLFDTSSIAATLHVEGEGQEYASGEDGMGLVFRASLGQLAVFIQDGDALIDIAFDLGLDFSGEDIPGQKLIKDVTFGDFETPVISKNEIDIVLPMFFGGEGPDNYIGDFAAYGNLGTLTVETPIFSGIVDAINIGELEYDPFDNILLAFDTLNFYLEGLSDMLAGDVLGINLPFVGDQMADVLFIETFRNTLISTLKNGVENAINPNADTVTDLLTDLFAVGGLLNGYLRDGTTVVYDDNLDDGGTPGDLYRQWNFTLEKNKTYIFDNFDIGISNLGFDVDVPVSVEFTWMMDLGFGVNFVEGAYIDISDVDDLTLDLNITLPDIDGWSGTLGFLPLTVTDPNNDPYDTSDTGAIVNFAVDVKKGDTTANHLGFSDLGNINPVATVEGSPLGNAADGNDDDNPDAVTLHLVTTAITGLPSLWTDLVINWSLPTTEVSLLEGDAVTPGIQLIALQDMVLDAGSVAESLLGPLFGEIAGFIEPFMPVIDTLTYPIPILSDIAGEPFTLLDLAAIFGSVDPAFIGAVADIMDVISKINDFMQAPDLPLGDLVLYQYNPVSDEVIIGNFIPNDPTKDLADIGVTAVFMGDPATTPGWTFDKDAYDAVINSNDFLKDARDGKLADGLTMPIFTDPRQGVMLLLDQNAVMIDYLLPPLSVEFEYLQLFPIFGPLAVSIEISFGFTLDLHSVGFDTTGYQRYADGGFRNAALIFDGFYLNDLDEEGTDAPEVLFEFGLVGAAELNLGIARAGVGGGIDAQIYFDWYDAIPDGRVHISEMAGSMWANDGNPIAVFDVGGKLTFQMFAFLEISIIGFEQEFPITPETELFSFEIPFKRPPVLATRTDDGTLILNMGPNAEDRLNGNTSDGHEDISMESSGNTVYVWSDKLGVGYGDKQTFTDINEIVGIGGEGNDTINLNLTGSTGIRYTLEGGNGDDNITVTGGTGDGVIRGGVGNDTLTGGDGDDIIYGEEGNDYIEGGGGSDILFGDFGRVFENLATADPLITSRVTDADGADEIHGGDGDDIIIGGGGDDKLYGDAGDDVIIGDGGRFAYEEVGGHFDITAITGTDLWRDPDDLAKFVYPYTPEVVDTSTPTDPDTISKDIDKIYDAVMGTFSSTDLGFGGNDTISGGEGGDIILGGSADDIINGDGGNDIILGGKGFDDVHGGAGNDTIFGGDQADTIFGDEDDDVISGGAGNDLIHGNTGNDVMKGDSGADVMYGDADNDQVFGQTEPDILFGGIGNDLVVGGTGNDIMFGDDGLVAKLVPEDMIDDVDENGDPLYVDKIIGKDPSLLPADQFRDGDIRTVDLIITTVVAGDGDDFLSGDAGDDIMLGGGGNDTMGGDVDPRLTFDNIEKPTEISEDVMIGDGGKIVFDQRRFKSIATIIGDTTGSPFNDTIYGDNGNDYILGGRGDDILAGGHGPDRGATDPEASDNDVIIGDNGELVFADETFDSAFGDLKLITTTDEANDTGGADTVYGEEGADVILGGVNNGGTDNLYGDYYDYNIIAIPPISIGNDVILGDNGLLDFDYNDDDHNLNTLDLIHSEPYAVDWTTDPPTLDTNTILGGADIIDGSFGYDVLIGGVGGDTMYGDDETALNAENDGEDIMLGDNADIFLIGTEGRLLVQVAAMTAGTAVDLITTTDTEDATGGPDTMSGNAKADIMLGGVNNDDGNILNGIEKDVMYGDRGGTNLADQPTEASILHDGDDILLGDNGSLDFTFGGDESNLDRQTLDLIQSFEDTLGGKDVISGNKGLDVAIGGTGGDEIYGDDTNASAAEDDLGDLLLGDNADISLVAKGTDAGGDLKLVLPLGLATDAAVMTIRTTDTVDPDNTGGSDIISGNAKGDIIAGGVYGDTLYGDRETPNATTIGDEGDDIILGDNGAFEWLSNGRLSEITGINIAANNPALWTKYGTGTYDNDLGTLDLITTEQPTSGGRDLIYGDQGRDLVFAGTDADTIYGDDGTLDEIVDSSNNDLLFGDHGRIYPQFSTLRAASQDWRLAFNSRNFFAIDIGNTDGGEGDRMWGEEGDDTMVGQQGDDRMWGGSGDDDMTGGHNVSGGYDELTITTISASLDGTGIATPAIDNVNDLMDGGSGDDSMAGDNAIIWRRGDDFSPRFRALTVANIYSTDIETITANIGGDWQSDPADAIGRDIQLIDHSDTTATGLYGSDVMAGGADSDVMFGELANDLMQGDGSIGTDADTGPNTEKIIIDDSAGSTGGTLYFNVPEAVSDADDYMEGNGGSDLMYGGLGQDDMIGGSSALFGLRFETDPSKENYALDPEGEYLRPDSSDFIFGGAGIDTDRNDIGNTTFNLASIDANGVITTVTIGHARDADYIMGDNANVYRLVKGGASGTNQTDPKDVFLTFNYDNYGLLKIIPRAMQQLDYTLGGADYNEGEYVNGAAQLTGQPADNGAADLIHGESGDDIIFGMTGSDVIFGEGQDDDIVGGYGHDWISGGTGQDGVLGDDGLIYTSRNSTLGEPLYGIAGLLAKDADPKYANGNALNEVISTPGTIQYAVINISGELKKTIDLVPFSYDSTWLANDDEFPDNQDDSPYADDIIFGGLGSDWLHGGSGDDAISGAEALENAYVPDYYDFDQNDTTFLLNLGYTNAGLPANLNLMNPGDVLAFNPEDTDGRHLNNRFRAGEFALYDEYEPLRKIQLDASGNLWKSSAQGTTYEFLLNFDKTEGVVRPAGTVPKATGQQAENYPQVYDDGKDAIFGDLGNDWLVGGTGADDMYGGWGNDLLNADDNQDTNGGLNDIPDTHPYYQDRAYGGAGRDVLIGNTGGDRLIDWVGEYNSYLVPYAPFGQASVSRTLQPFLPEFLYALSAGDGADPTRNHDTGADPLRNGEPDAEMGLVLQKDNAWQDQTGAPADPQAGNIPGGARDVLRSAGFNDGTADGFYVESGTWSVVSGRYQVAPTVKGGDALSVFYVDQYIPNYFEMLATINSAKPTSGYNSNAYLLFDYQNATDFKFAGINVSTNKLEIGYRDVSGWHVVAQKPYTTSLKADTDYNVFLALNGTNVILKVNNQVTLTYTFAPRVDVYGITHGLKDGMVGLGANNGKAKIDNVTVQRVAPVTTVNKIVDFSSGTTNLFQTPLSGTWRLAAGRYAGTAGVTPAIDLTAANVTSASLIDFSATFRTTGEGGFVYDLYGAEDFKYVTISAGKITLGHRTPKGWFTDAVYSNATLVAGSDYTLGVNLKGTTVSVLLNNQLVLSKSYNALVTDGSFGLFSRSGITSFDTVTFKSDDPTLTSAAFLLASAPAQGVKSGVALSADTLMPIVNEAVNRWTLALGVTEVAALNGITVVAADLPEGMLGEALGATILIDIDAAGNGWFIDYTPYDDAEFNRGLTSRLLAPASSVAFGDMDLLTVVMHEMGHVLGFEDLDPYENPYNLMSSTLDTSTRSVIMEGIDIIG